MTTKPMRIAVVGAGIAGLTVAAALSRAGVRAEVYEQAEELGEVGAGIQLSPNATRLLHRLGLADQLRARAVRPQAVQMRRWDDDTTLSETTLGDECEAMYHAPYYTVHRADLHRALLDQVGPETIHLGRRCVEVQQQPDEVTLRFADGSTAVADVVVGADGIRSAVRTLLAADEARFSGQTVYRGLIPAYRVEPLAEQPRVQIWLGPGQHFVCYPISRGSLVSFVATTPAGDWHTESWNTAGRVEDLRADYAGWNAEVTRLIEAADRVTRWALHHRDPLEQWSDGRVTVTGDAAHPMLPFGAQGAAQAIEDAVTLAGCLAAATPATAADALRRYEEIRKPRVTEVARFIRENAKNHHYSDGPDQQDRDRAMTDNWGLRGQSWLFGFDAGQGVDPALTVAP